MALQGTGRPEEALRYLREAAQLDMSLHVGVTNHTLPEEIRGKRLELDDLADVRAKEHRSTLLAKRRTSKRQRISVSSISSGWRFAQNCVKRTRFQMANTFIVSLD